MLLSVVVPIFNEEENIRLLHERLCGVVKKLNTELEFIFVNDGSRDNSLAIIKLLAASHSNVKFIDFSRNFGHQIAVTAGLDIAKGDAVVIIDADLQDPPELIAEMFAKWQEGFEVVYAKRKERRGENFFKKFSAKLFYRVINKMISFNIPMDTGDFRIVDRKIVDVLKSMPEQQKFLRGQISWAGFKQTYVEYDRDARHAGETGYTFKKMIKFALDGITSFSDAPLKLASLIGFIVSGFAFLMILYALYARFISRDYVQGWTSLMLAVLFLGGIQLICLGMIGEYISRVANNIKNRPLYIIRETNTDQ
jgi:glycosyltransferase involved in cell wall biosynthesis